MAATIIDGRAISKEIRAELHEQVKAYIQQQNVPPGLAIVRVEGDPASAVYARAILRLSEDIGINAHVELLPSDISSQELYAILHRLNTDLLIQGILVQMPLPAHLPQKLVIDTLAAEKDIDGISSLSAGNLFLGLPSFLPSTAAAVIEILERTQTPLTGKRVVVLGRSNVVGKPLSMMLLQKNATVTVCHSRTPHLATFTREADVLIAAVGQPHMVTPTMIRPGATVIDVGINALPEGGITGDVDFEAVKHVAGAITPTPGGVGPLTNILLLKQCIQAAWQQLANHVFLPLSNTLP